ncbi:MAG: 30S ribosomal protein S16 [Candidatus Berkelbacteria bacterium]
MLKIRLSRVGKSHTPIYRLVVAEKSRAVKRENIEILGLYNPGNKEDRFQVKKDRVLYWISMGAQPSDTARNLLCDFDVLPKKDKIKVVHGKATKKKVKEEAPATKPEVAESAAEESVQDPAPQPEADGPMAQEVAEEPAEEISQPEAEVEAEKSE